MSTPCLGSGGACFPWETQKGLQSLLIGSKKQNGEPIPRGPPADMPLPDKDNMA